MTMVIPAYLNKINDIDADHYYGELQFEEYTNSWVITGEPAIIDMAKRLFPGCDGRGGGKARFPNNKRINGDLNWLMQRFPLKVVHVEKWEQSYNAAVQHVLMRDELNRLPQQAIPPIEFRGELKDFQKEGLAFLFHNRRSLLADEMGLGKTAQAIAFMAATKAYPTLIVVPPHLIRNWQKELDKFIDLPDRELTMFNNNNDAVHVIKGLRPYELPKANVYIIHYLLLRGWKNKLPELGFKAVIFDEIQELRHTRTEKYSAASLVAGSTENVLGLSGTPIYNRGGEIWAVTNIIEYHCMGDWESFTREWCYGYGNDIVRNPQQLGEYLRREGLMIRRTKEQVLKELPPKRRVVQTVDFDSGRYSDLIEEAVAKALRIDGIGDYLEKGRLTREIVNEGRRAIGIAKAPYVVTFIKMLLEAGERVLLFAYHHDVWDIYREQLNEFNPVFITGKETSSQKDAAVEAFKNKKTQICCISLRAAAGIDGLQGSSCVVFGELDWSPAIHSQAEDRAHRMGQEDSVLCYYLVAEEGTDETIQEFLGLKVSQFVGIMGDRPETEDDKLMAQVKATEHMNKIVQKLKQRR